MKLTALVLSAFLAASLFAAPAEIDLAAAAVAGKEASFTQRFTPKGFKTAQVESGLVTFGKLPQMRWAYDSPEQKLFVFDGTQSWFYVPADRQVTVSRLDESSKRELPFLVLSDPAARERDFVVREERKGAFTVTTLRPRERASVIREIVVTTNAADHLITGVEYGDREGNRTAFDLAGYHPRNAAADAFRFTPPAGTQVVNAQ